MLRKPRIAAPAESQVHLATEYRADQLDLDDLAEAIRLLLLNRQRIAGDLLSSRTRAIHVIEDTTT